jgi:hypothetical protein
VQAEWGYVPGFVKTRTEANIFRAKYTTLNFKSENLFLKEDGKRRCGLMPPKTGVAWFINRVSWNHAMFQNSVKRDRS